MVIVQTLGAVCRYEKDAFTSNVVSNLLGFLVPEIDPLTLTFYTVLFSKKKKKI